MFLLLLFPGVLNAQREEKASAKNQFVLFDVEYTYTKTDSVQVEKTGMGKFLLSSKQQIQSPNLNSLPRP